MMTYSLQLFAPWRSRRAGRIRKEKLHPVGNYHDLPCGKPSGGVWTSTYTPLEKTESDWLRFCTQEHPYWIPAYGYLYSPDPAARLFTIDSVSDLQSLVSEYGVRKVCCPPYEIDWNAVARDYEGVHLTRSGLAAGEAHGLESWDAECTVWFRIDGLRYAGRIRLCRSSVPKRPPEKV